MPTEGNLSTRAPETWHPLRPQEAGRKGKALTAPRSVCRSRGLLAPRVDSAGRAAGGGRSLHGSPALPPGGRRAVGAGADPLIPSRLGPEQQATK